METNGDVAEAGVVTAAGGKRVAQSGEPLIWDLRGRTGDLSSPQGYMQRRSADYWLKHIILRCGRWRYTFNSRALCGLLVIFFHCLFFNSPYLHPYIHHDVATPPLSALPAVAVEGSSIVWSDTGTCVRLVRETRTS